MPGDHGDLYGLRIQTTVPENVAPGSTVVWIDTSVHPHPVKCVHRDAAGLETVHEAGGATAEQVEEVVAQLGLATPEDLAGLAQAVHAHTEYATPAEVDSAILAATTPLTGLLGHTHTGTYAPASHALDGASHSGVGVLPTQGQKNALAGTQGTPGTGNEYVTTQDARNTNARTPTAHAHAIADTTGLQAALDGKAATGHTHAGGGYATPAGPALALDVNGVVKMTPAATVTYTTAVPAAGSERVVILLQSNTTAKTITFGAGFKPTATLVLGTTANRVFVVRFVSDGTSLYEASRTAAITA